MPRSGSGRWQHGRVPPEQPRDPRSARPGGGRVVLHVGLPKTGTTWLQALLAAHRDELRAGGVVYPFVRPGAMFHGAVDVRGSRARFGLAAEQVEGAWAAVCARAGEFLDAGGRTAVISHEVLGGAAPDQVERALAPLAGREMHVVVTARDLGRQATAHWQEEVKLGATWSFADLEREQLRADTGREPAGPDDGGSRPHFWHAQDLVGALQRWTARLGPDRGHLVLCPPPGAPAAVLWERFAEAAGVDPALVDPGLSLPGNASLGAPETALLRAVNRALGDRLDPRARARVVKQGYAEGELAATGSARPLAPAGLAEVLVPATRAWLDEVAAAGWSVHGDPADLDPVLAPPGDPTPDVEAVPGVDPAAVARRLLDAAGAAGEVAVRPRRRWWR